MRASRNSIRHGHRQKPQIERCGSNSSLTAHSIFPVPHGIALPTWEKMLFAFEPIKRIASTNTTRMNAIMIACSATGLFYSFYMRERVSCAILLRSLVRAPVLQGPAFPIAILQDRRARL